VHPVLSLHIQEEDHEMFQEDLTKPANIIDTLLKGMAEE
jgi:hypothetical protein